MTAFSFRNYSVSALFFALAIGAPSAVSAQHDPAVDFSPVLNPNGVWSYGYENFPLPNPFNLLTVPVPAPIDSWQTPSFGKVGVFHNGTAVPQPYITASDGATYQPGEIGMHPGPNDQYGVIQFKAPTAGLYMIQGVFEGLDSSNLTNTSVAILFNNSPVLTGNVIGDGVASDVPLSFGPVFLNAGDSLAYAVGGNPVFGSTGLVPGSALVSAVPEPTSLALPVGAAFLWLAGTRRFRRRKSRRD